MTRRQKLASDAGPIPEYPIEDIIESCLPPVSENVITYPNLSGMLDLGLCSEDGHWAGFDTDPADSSLSENDYFSPLSELFQKVILALNQVAEGYPSAEVCWCDDEISETWRGERRCLGISIQIR